MLLLLGVWERDHQPVSGGEDVLVLCEFLHKLSINSFACNSCFTFLLLVADIGAQQGISAWLTYKPVYGTSSLQKEKALLYDQPISC
jgi:hypothetical protein